MIGRVTRPGPRASSVWFASAAAILPVTMLNSAAARPEAIASGTFTPPAGPMILTRELRRPLGGGVEVSTRRSYEITFRPDARGFVIEGKLLDAQITAPPQFERLAALERSRPDDGMFPMRVDRNGRFLPGNTPPPDEAGEAGRIAHGMVAGLGLSAGQTREADSFIGQVAGSPVRTAWPVDLLMPAPGKHSQTLTIPLPGGRTGQVSIDTDALTDARSGLVKTFRRQVTTRLDGTSRVTLETWTLHRAG